MMFAMDIGGNMRIVISNQSELPIYAQIREQIKEQILNGSMEEGMVLPSIRQLAKELGISVITTTRAYNDLEQEGFIASIQGRGSIVQKKDNNMIRGQYMKRIEEHLESAIATAKQLEMEEDELIMILKNLMKSDE